MTLSLTPPPPSSASGRALPEGLDLDVLTAAWFGSIELRGRAHQVHGEPGCPTRGVPYLAAVPARPTCHDSDCLGLFDEVYVRALPKLGHAERQGRVRSRPAYARRVVATLVADLERSRRVSRGQPARPTRSDGPAERVIRDLVASHDPESAEWLEALFRLMRSWVHREHRTSSTWPLDAWASEKCRQDGDVRSIGSPSAQREILADIREVLESAGRVNGPRWVADTIFHPLQVIAPISLDDALAVPAADPVDPVDRLLLLDVGREFSRLRGAGLGDQDAWVDAVRSVFGVAPVEHVRRVRDDLPTRRPPSSSAGQAS